MEMLLLLEGMWACHRGLLGARRETTARLLSGCNNNSNNPQCGTDLLRGGG
jgi:hypothetical protein